MIKSLATVAALLLVLTGCGGSSGDDAKAAKAISEDIMSQSDSSSGLSVTQKQADCIGTGAVKEFGTDKLISLGLLTKDMTTENTSDITDLSEADAKKMVQVFVGCVDIVQIIKDEVAKDPTMATLPDSVKTCIDTTLTEDVAVALLVDEFSGTSAGQEDFQQKLMACAMGS